MKSQIHEFDVCIIGAGMVGAASACMLAQLGLRIALVEPNMPQQFDSNQPPDLRVSALNKHSIQLLEQCGALDAIKAMRYRAYTSLSVWENEGSFTSFAAQDVGEATLGIFAENRLIQLALLDAVKRQHEHQIRIFNVSTEQIDTKNGEINLSDSTLVKTKLIVGADGANSQVRRSAGIGQNGWQYQQRANLISVKMHAPFADETWQQFIPSGPLAFLPMHENYASLVWYASSEESKRLLAMANDELKIAVKNTFPDKLVDFEVLAKAGFGLTRMHANHYFQDKAALVGDAAHTINPLAGQGVNLGFKDVSALASSIKKYSIKENAIQQQGIHAENLELALRDYQKARKSQNLLMMSAMDALYATFSNDITPIRVFRNIALGAAQKAGPLKNRVLKYAMGL